MIHSSWATSGAIPNFKKKYGRDYGGTTGYQVSAPWQTGLSMASTLGALIGESHFGGG